MDWQARIFEEFRRGRLEPFYTHLYPDLLVYASRLLRGEDVYQPEDCVQEAVARSYRRCDTFADDTQWRAFLISTIRNFAISVLRHTDARTNYLNSLDREPSVTPDLLNDYIEVETRIRINNAVASLPDELRQVFALSFEEGLRNQEIAERLGVAEITVKKRKARLISRLKDVFGNDAMVWSILGYVPDSCGWLS